MDLANWFANSPLIETLGGVLLQFVWQGAVIAILLALALWMLRGRSALLRYTVCCGAMLLMLAAPAITFTLAMFSARLTVTGAALPGVGGAGSVRLLPYTPVVESVVRSPLGPVLPWMVAGWAAGILLLSLRILGGWWRIRALTRTGVSNAPPALQATVRDLARRLGVSRPITLLQSTLAQVPSAIGWIKPVVLLPAQLLTGLTATQLESLLAHEIAHIRRYDYLVNLAQTAIETLLFYHPAVWWTGRRIREERENCCDDLAVAACGDALTYARALAELEGMRSAPRMAMAAAGGDLMRRIRRLVAPDTQRSGPRAAGIVALSIVALVLGAAFAQSRPADAVDTADLLFVRLHARDWRVDGEVGRLLDQTRISGNIEPFLAALKTRLDWQSREKAAWVLGMVGRPAALDGLIAALRDESPAVRHTAAWALGAIGDPQAVDALIANLKDGHSEARAGAAWGIGRIGNSRGVDALVGALKDPADDVGAAAAWGLGMIGDPRASDALTIALRDGSHGVRQKSAEALARLRR